MAAATVAGFRPWADLRRPIRRRGFLDNAVVVFLSDHGEEFLEHGRLSHGESLFEPNLRIPLLIHRGGSAAMAPPMSAETKERLRALGYVAE